MGYAGATNWVLHAEEPEHGEAKDAAVSRQQRLFHSRFLC